jgi:N-glycosidase YbiA
MAKILFYTTKTKWGCFSNFSRHGFFLDEKYYGTSEAYYQSQKFITTDPAYAEEIRNAPNPKTAALLGRASREGKPSMRTDWDDVKDDIMRKVVMHKFTVHETCRKTLLSTGDDEIVEDTRTSGDAYWGCGTDGKGKNMLGVILMETRQKLRDKYSIAT